MLFEGSDEVLRIFKTKVVGNLGHGSGLVENSFIGLVGACRLMPEPGNGYREIYRVLALATRRGADEGVFAGGVRC